MPDYRFQISAAADSGLARDRYVNTLHFVDSGLTSDPTGLCQDLAEIFRDHWYVSAREITVKAYEIGPPPQFPKGEHTLNVGQFTATPGIREVALCLSYFAERPLPRQRGRIYLPAFAGGAANSLRPNATIMNKAVALAGLIDALGGADVQWVVYSPTDNETRDVTGVWCDDEWDTVRSRGLRPTTRVTGSV